MSIESVYDGKSECESIGNNDLRLYAPRKNDPFAHVVLKDVDDGDTIVVNEDDLVLLRNRLTEIIKEHGLEQP